MTAGDPAPPHSQPHTTAPGRRTHRMLDSDRIRERFNERPEVAEWILAVRDELVIKFGEVGTLSKFAHFVKAKRPLCGRTVQQLRRRASEQLTTAPGPSSKLAEHVLTLVVPAERRDDVSRRFAALYAAAHGGEPAPFGATAKQPDPAPPPVETIPAGSATTGELRELVTELRQMIRAAEQRETVALAELATRTEEANRLRLNLSAVNLVATATRRRTTGSTGASDGGGPPVQHVPRPRSDRYDSLAALDPQHAGERWTIAGDLDLETYWLGGIWNDLRHRPAAGDGLDSREVASQFGVIARTLSREGVGVGVGEPAPEDPATSPADEQPKQTGCQAARERVPRDWTSHGPPWFYALLGVFVTAGVLAVPLALLVALNAPAAPPEDDNNFVVTLINERYP